MRRFGTLIDRAVPARWRLPLEIARYRRRNGLEPEWHGLARLVGDGRRTAVDVGANIGWYSYRLRRWFERVVAFEPNPEAAAILRAYGARNVDVHACALGAAAGTARLHVPYAAGAALHGWATLNTLLLPEADEIRTIDVPLRALDEFRLRDVDFLKIDAEGAEADILAGARDTVMRWHPIVLIEVRDRHEQVSAFFENLGYAAFHFAGGRLVPFSGSLSDDPRGMFLFRTS